MVKRALQALHSRRRRIESPVTEGREFTTRVSGSWQKGQFNLENPSVKKDAERKIFLHEMEKLAMTHLLILIQ